MPALNKRTYYHGRELKAGLARRYLDFLEGCDTVLDVGCGTGEFGRFFPGTIVGLDNDASAVAAAGRYEEALVADLGNPLPFEDESFDGILAKDILEHLIAPWDLVAEFRRVLRPGGRVVASVVQDRPRRVWADYTHVRGFSKATARGLFEDQGFDVRSVWPMGGVPLTNRLGLMNAVPRLLAVPGFGALWASSWELLAQAPSVDVSARRVPDLS